MSSVINIKELDLDMLQPNLDTMNKKDQGSQKIVIVSPPGSGKSFLVRDIYYKKRHIYPVSVVFSGTEDSNHFYESFIPKSFIYNEYDPTAIEKVIKRQKLALNHLKNPWAILTIDDCADDTSIFTTPLQRGLFKNGRHWKCLYLLCIQYAMDIRPDIRNNIDGVFIFREPSLKYRKILYENYASIIPDFTTFCAIMDQITGDYTALYIHKQTTTNNWLDCVYYYKAEEVPSDWKFGSKDYWNFHKQRYNHEYVEPTVM